MMKRYIYSVGITLSMIYLLHQFDRIHMAGTKHVDTIFIISLFVLLTSACIYVARTNFFGLFMQGWKKVGRVMFRKPDSMKEVDEMIRSDVGFNEWISQLTSNLMVYTFGSGSALFVVSIVLSVQQ